MNELESLESTNNNFWLCNLKIIYEYFIIILTHQYHEVLKCECVCDWTRPGRKGKNMWYRTNCLENLNSREDKHILMKGLSSGHIDRGANIEM